MISYKLQLKQEYKGNLVCDKAWIEANQFE